jgi:hypothetical protein
LSLNAATGAITGTPSALGTFCFTVRVTDANGISSDASFCITIDPQLTLTVPAQTVCTIGSPCSISLPFTGGTAPYSCSVIAGTLPAGLTLATTTNSCLISGTPTVNGIFGVNVRVMDSNSRTTQKGVTITVNEAILTIPGVTGSYATLQSAFGAVPDGGSINLRDLLFSEALIFDRPVAITLRGGYDAAYSTNQGVTTISGELVIAQGTVTVENIAIK